jgi:anion-transporting  ArsA/GET3 family ATPase
MRTAFALADYQLILCLGPGGVGKTTISAALALDAAIRGRKADVMTIDPAPRLIDALGLRGDTAEPRLVDLDGLRAKAGGQLRASRLDPKRTFDDLVVRHAPSAAARDAILSGRIYHNLSNALAGVADYMAMERLLELYREGTADLIVLDTPPAHEALDFLDAPRRMLELMGSRAVSLLSASRNLMPTQFGVLDLAARAVLAGFDRFTGLRLLTDVQAFVAGFDGMYEGFAVRAAAAQKLLLDPATLIVLVTTAEPERINQTREFVDALNERGLRLGALVVNRLMETLPDGAAIARTELPAALRRKLHRNLADFAVLKHRETVALDALRSALPPEVPVLAAAELSREPLTLRELAAVAARFEIHGASR